MRDYGATIDETEALLGVFTAVRTQRLAVPRFITVPGYTSALNANAKVATVAAPCNAKKACALAGLTQAGNTNVGGVPVPDQREDSRPTRTWPGRFCRRPALWPTAFRGQRCLPAL